MRVSVASVILGEARPSFLELASSSGMQAAPASWLIAYWQRTMLIPWLMCLFRHRDVRRMCQPRGRRWRRGAHASARLVLGVMGCQGLLHTRWRV